MPVHAAILVHVGAAGHEQCWAAGGRQHLTAKRADSGGRGWYMAHGGNRTGPHVLTARRLSPSVLGTFRQSRGLAVPKAMPCWPGAFDVHPEGRWLSNRLCAQGYNVDGQVGDGTKSNRLTPTQVHFDGWWEAVSTGDRHTCGIRTGGQLWCWVSARGCVTLRMGDAVGYAFC